MKTGLEIHIKTKLEVGFSQLYGYLRVLCLCHVYTVRLRDRRIGVLESCDESVFEVKYFIQSVVTYLQHSDTAPEYNSSKYRRLSSNLQMSSESCSGQCCDNRQR